jgi:hypothetical protein
MNVVDHGTNLAKVIEKPFTSENMRKLFANSLIFPFVAPEVIFCDGGPEFRSYFERSAELSGIFLHAVNSESPWQNGKTERHGALIEDLLAKACEGNVVQDSRDLSTLLTQVLSQTNARVSRGGYSPHQVVFGKGARVLEALCEEGATNDLGLQERFEPSPDEVTAAAAFRKACFLGEEARKVLVHSDFNERIKRAIKAPKHTAKDFFKGQWVYVWRRAQKRAYRKPGAPLRDRWCGPGIVILAEPGLVWVAIQHRVWRCSPEQVRSATNFNNREGGHQVF